SESARVVLLRPLQLPQTRSHFQVLGSRHALRMFDGCAIERSTAIDQGPLMISIFDYGAGNLRSVQNTLDEIGASYELVSDAAALESAAKIILPGVGHFGQMLRALDEMNVRNAFISRIKAGVPFLGICLGLQGLFESSEEAPEQQGLGIFKGKVKRFDLTARVPHMGWNQLDSVR